jgi:hypothetical protein
VIEPLLTSRELGERLANPDAVLSRTDLRDLGYERRAVDAIFRRLPRGGSPRLFPAAYPCQRLRRLPRRLHLQRKNPCPLRRFEGCCPIWRSSWRDSDGNPALSLRPP